MQKSVTKYFTAADNAIQSCGFINANGQIPAAYKGAISSFGASIVMSGLIPTIQFYMASSQNRLTDSMKIVEAIAKIINTANPSPDALQQSVLSASNNAANLFILKKQIIDAAIALKIMMRTYQFESE